MAQSYEAEAQVIGVKISRGQAKTREFEEITAFLLQGQNPARCLLLWDPSSWLAVRAQSHCSCAHGPAARPSGEHVSVIGGRFSFSKDPEVEGFPNIEKRLIRFGTYWNNSEFYFFRGPCVVIGVTLTFKVSWKILFSGAVTAHGDFLVSAGLVGFTFKLPAASAIWGTELFEHLPNLYYSHGNGNGNGNLFRFPFLESILVIDFL